MNRNLSFKERLHNALAVHEIENVKGMHGYTHACGRGAREWSTIWNRSKDATWAHGFGRMVGFEEIWYDSVVGVDILQYQQYGELVKLYPEIAGMDPLAVGSGSLHTLASEVIEIADDGKSARTFFLTPGPQIGIIHRSGHRVAELLWERYGSDFVYEDGQWKYFHEQVCPDVFSAYDTANWAHDRYYDEINGVPMRDGGGILPLLTDPGTRHNDYTSSQPVQNTVPWPVPYQTLDDDNSYAPGYNNPNHF